jgi:DNA-binding transcriptional LysR family regulator
MGPARGKRDLRQRAKELLMQKMALRRYFRHGLFPQLMVFEAVARLGSVTRAAEELHLAQPTVSTQLRKLQDALGLRLVEWRGRRMELTEAGRELHRSCTEVFALFGALEHRLAAHRAGSTAGNQHDGADGESLAELLLREALGGG